MARETTTTEAELARLRSWSVSQEEMDARGNAFDEDIKRIGEFLPEESLRRYIKENHERLFRKNKDEILVPELSSEKLAEIKKLPKETKGFWDKILKIAGKTLGELISPAPFEKHYAEDIFAIRCYLVQNWLSILLSRYEFKKGSHTEVTNCLRDDLFPEQSGEDIERIGGTYVDCMRGHLVDGNLFYEDLQDACYAEFAANVKTYLAAHPEGLVVRSYENVRLFKEGDKYVVRKV